MSLDVLLNTYGHHHPDYPSDAVEKNHEPRDERRTKQDRIWCSEKIASRAPLTTR